MSGRDPIPRYMVRSASFSIDLPGSTVVKLPREAYGIQVCALSATMWELLFECPHHYVEGAWDVPHVVFGVFVGEEKPTGAWRVVNVTPRSVQVEVDPFGLFTKTSLGERLPIVWYVSP